MGIRRTHLSDDKTIAKIGHPDLDVGHPSEREYLPVEENPTLVTIRPSRRSGTRI